MEKKNHLTRLDVDICGDEERVQSQLAMMIPLTRERKGQNHEGTLSIM